MKLSFLRVVGLAVLSGALLYSTQRAWQQVSAHRAVEATCTLASTQAEDALLASEGVFEGLAPADPLRGLLVDCRCEALSRVGRPEACAALVDLALADNDSSWIDPNGLPQLAHTLAAGDAESTLSRLLPIAAKQVRLDHEVLRAWFLVMATHRTPEEIAEALLPHIAQLPPADSTDLRLAVATLLAEQDLEASLRYMDPAPASADPLRDSWYAARAQRLGQLGRQPDVVRTMAAWVDAGGNPDIAYLYYGIVLSTNLLTDADRPSAEILETGLERAPPETPTNYLETAYIRLIIEAANAGQPKRAADLASEAARRGLRIDPDFVDDATRGQPTEKRVLELRVQLADPAPGDRLWFIPGAPSAPDAPPGVGEETGEGTWRWRTTLLDRATRWVAADAAGQVLASGSVLATAIDRPVMVGPVPRKPRPPLPLANLDLRRQADGRRQVFVVVVDCADWNMVRYLGARGDLPWIRALEEGGVAGVLQSEPPFTGVAMEKLAHPSVTKGLTVTQYLFQLGVELQGLESVGFNPLEPLGWVLPESPYLVDLVGEGDRRAMNLLFSHGGINVGRNAEIVGPAGKRETVEVAVRRALRPNELSVLQEHTPSPTGARFLEEMAAELDTAVAHVRSGEVDLLLLRIEQTDLLTHATYAAINRTQVDDARGDLFAAYRYADRRIGDIFSASDADDVLIVMSDHGIHNALVHAPEAVFIAYGLGRGTRLVGQPELGGMPRLLTALLGVAGDPRWPETPLLEQVLGASP